MNPAIRIKLRQLLPMLCIALLLFLFGLSSTGVEKFYSDGLYRYSSVVQRQLSTLFPFAVGDFLYILLIIFCLWSVFKAVRKLLREQPDQTEKILLLLKLSRFLLLVYIVFKLLWGLNYSRPSISARLGISDEKYTTKELVLLGDFLIDRVNLLKARLNSRPPAKTYTIQDLEDRSKNAYDRMAKVNSFFSYPVPAVKPVLFSVLISKMGLAGYYCPPSGEANVNMLIPPAELPFIACHEISHELGIAREDEANLIGYMVSTNSPDADFQYSGNYDILRSVLFEIRIKSPEDFERLYKKINAGTLDDFRRDQEFWRKYDGDMSDYMGDALDKFLKINNQPRGTKSYQDIVLWVFNLHKKELNLPSK